MHELSIMQSALSLALDQARQAGGSRVHTIRLRIGALSGVVPDALEFAFEALAPGTPAEGAKLAIEHVPARFWCANMHAGISVGRSVCRMPRLPQPKRRTARRPGDGIGLIGD